MHPGEPASVAPDAIDVTTRQPRRMPLALATVGLIAVVLAVVASLFAIKLTSQRSGTGPPVTPPAPGSVVSATTTVPAGVLAAVGAPGPPVVTAPVPLDHTTALRSHGLPLLVYVGAEYCPFCAAERWALVEALSHFGTFSDLGSTSSAVQLVFPEVPSFSFRGATFRSRLLRFDATETYSSSASVSSAFVPLQQVPTQQDRLMRRLDVPPLAPTSGTLPFVDIAGRSTIIGSQFTPAILVGLSMGTIAGDLSDPTSPVAAAIDGAANDITAAICSVTGQQPSTICQSSAVQAGSQQIAAQARHLDNP